MLNSPEGYRYPIASNALLVAIGATYFGFGDFILYQAPGTDGRFDIFGFLKPSFLTPSDLLVQLFTFVATGMFLFLALLVFTVMVKRRKWMPPFMGAGTIAVALLSIVIITLRWWQHSGGPVRLMTMVAISVVVVVISGILTGTFQSNLEREMPRRSRAHAAFVVIIAIPYLAAFFLPDVPFRMFPSQSDAAPGGAFQPNVLLIVLDTVRVDRLSCYGCDDCSTPSIERIAQDGLLFMNAYATAPWTVPSHASMFTGLQSGELHVGWGSARLADKFVTMAEYLSAQGYVTAGFSENPLVGHSTGLTQGFPTFFDSWRRPLLARALSRLAARAGFLNERKEYADRTNGMFRYWLHSVRRGGRPFFVFINYMAAHLPNYPRHRTYEKSTLKKIQPVNLVPERFYLPEFALDSHELGVMGSIYGEDIEHLDGKVGELMEFLASSGVLDDTIVIITSDHGENFGEHGFIEHQLCLYNTLIHVPLIIRYPTVLAPRVVSENVSTVALLATVAALVGTTDSDIDGENQPTPLHLVAEDQTIIAEYSNGVEMLREAIETEAPSFDYTPFDRSLSCLIVGNHKLIADSNGNHELFNLENDPYELIDLSLAEPEITGLLAAAYRSPSFTGGSARDSTVGTPIDPDTLDALRSLGYVR